MTLSPGNNNQSQQPEATTVQAPVQSQNYNLLANFTRWYLDTYYAPPPSIDEIAINKFMIEQMDRLGRTFDKYVEISCEATVHHAVPFAPRVKDIIMSDFRDEARAETALWQSGSPDAFCWDHYVEMSLRHEGIEPTPEAIAARTTEIREKIEAIVPCDVLGAPIVKVPLTPDTVVGMFFVAGEVGENLDGWKGVMKNVCDSIPPGGHVFISALRDMSEYVVHRPDGSESTYPCACLHERDFEELLPQLGFTGAVVKGLEIPNPDVGLKGVIMVSATKTNS